MCFFLTVAVPAKQADRIAEIFNSEFLAMPYVNTSVTTVLPAGYVTIAVTCGMCSCDLYGRPSSDGNSTVDEQLRRKYERLGWSESRIARALKQKEASRKNSGRRITGIRSDVIERLKEACQICGSVAVFVHWYTGDFSTEELSFLSLQKCSSAQLLQLARELPEDTMLLAIK